MRLFTLTGVDLSDQFTFDNNARVTLMMITSTLTGVDLSDQFTFDNNARVTVTITCSVTARKRGRPLYVKVVEFSGTSAPRNSGVV